MKAGKPALYVYGVVTEQMPRKRGERSGLSKIEIRSERGDVALSLMAPAPTSAWLEIGTVVSVRLRTKKSVDTLAGRWND